MVVVKHIQTLIAQVSVHWVKRETQCYEDDSQTVMSVAVCLCTVNWLNAVCAEEGSARRKGQKAGWLQDGSFFPH